MKTIMLSAIAGASLIAVGAHAQAADPIKAYVDNGFAMMDADKNGSVDKAEFDRFMRARLARQSERFDAFFAEIDKNKDGRLSRAEAAASPGIVENFAEIDTNKDGSIDKQELKVAAAQAQMQDAGLDN